MIHLVRTGQVKAKQSLGDGEVEYAIVFRDGKLLAVDSKIVSTEDVSGLYEDKLSAEDRSRMVSKIKSAVKQKIPEVQNYIQPPHTLPMAVMALPDSVMEIVSDLIPEAMEKNVILLGYSAVPQLIGYFMRIHESYAVEQDVAVLKEKISMVQQEISQLDDRFFRNHLEKPLGTLDGALDKVRRVLFAVKNTLAFDTSATHEKPSAAAAIKREEEITVPAPH
jgi:DNA anti-recombination protein RmuC